MGVSHGLGEDPPELFVLLLKGHGVNDSMRFSGLPGRKSPIHGQLNREKCTESLETLKLVGADRFPLHK